MTGRLNTLVSSLNTIGCKTKATAASKAAATPASTETDAAAPAAIKRGKARKDNDDIVTTGDFVTHNMCLWLSQELVKTIVKSVVCKQETVFHELC